MFVGVARQVIVTLGFGRAHEHCVAEFGIIAGYGVAAKYALRLHRVQHVLRAHPENSSNMNGEFTQCVRATRIPTLPFQCVSASAIA